MKTLQLDTMVINPFTSIKDVPAMENAIRTHLTHNLQGIITQLELDGQRGVTSRASLIQSEKDMQDYLTDSRRISRLAEKLVRENLSRTNNLAKHLRALDLKSRDCTKKIRAVGDSKARKARQQARSAAAEAAKDSRVRGGKKSKK